MIIGNPQKLAIESDITRAIQTEDRLIPSGFFVLHVEGLRYGVHQPDATLLGCSIAEIDRRIERRGQHVVPFAWAPAGEIANAYRDAIYAPDQEKKLFLGIPHPEFEGLIHNSYISWAPDGDEAFDDGSYILQFDVGDKVRVIAFRPVERGYHHDPLTLRDLWVDEAEFYGVLERWRAAFADAFALSCSQKKA